jgi:hypothetical protein
MKTIRRISALAVFCLAVTPEEAPQIDRTWLVANGVVEAEYRYRAATRLFTFERLKLAGDVWAPPADSPVSPIRVRLDSSEIDAPTPVTILGSAEETIDREGKRLRILLRTADGLTDLALDIETFPGQPVVRHSVSVSPRSAPRNVRAADMLPFEFEGARGPYRAFRVNQWAVIPREVNFEPLENELTGDTRTINVRSGSGQLHCGWLAVRDANNRGLFFGWEFNGQTNASISHRDDQVLAVSAQVAALYRKVVPGETFRVPASFIGAFHGDWDEAGYRTQRYAEAAIAKPAPEGERFPFAAWDSWGYRQSIDEKTLRRNAEIAASIGIELFVVDLGWAPRIGDWVDDREKFPSGLRALSDYVHSLGMKFGIHFVPLEADPQSKVLADHPDWTSSRTYLYYGALSICPGHKPVREWVVREAVKIIDAYNVDWILQDGQTLVKFCNRKDHTHHPSDSNYSSSADGIDWIVEEVTRQRPHVVWENCANGGSMMTFKMLRNYVTSITNDASGSLGARQGMFGATYPFPPRYSDRYMPDTEISEYTTRSFVFGGPWIFMNKLTEMAAPSLDLARREIEHFKTLRRTVRDGKVFHLSARPMEGRTDAVQSLHMGAAVAVVTRDRSASPRYRLRLRGLDPAAVYRVRFADDRRMLTMSGAQLMDQGLPIEFPEERDAEIVFADPLPR